MDEVDFRKSLWCTRGRVDVVAAEVSPKVESLLNREVRKVLITERFLKVSRALSNSIGPLNYLPTTFFCARSEERRVGKEFPV